MEQRKVILYISMSLDGYIARRDGSIDWLPSESEMVETDHTYEEFYWTVDTVVLGKTTYEQVTNELSPNEYPYENVESYVLTSKNSETKKSIHFINEKAEELIKKLKNKAGKDIWIIGGQSIITPLINENLIDEYRIAIVPIILGEGIPLFKKITTEVPLILQETYKKNQLTYLSYKKVTF